MINNKTKLISTVGKIALGALAPEILAQGTKLVNAQLEKRKGYVKVPDVTALTVDEADEIMTQYHFIQLCPLRRRSNMLMLSQIKWLAHNRKVIRLLIRRHLLNFIRLMLKLFTKVS